MVENVEIMGLDSSLVASGYPMKTEINYANEINNLRREQTESNHFKRMGKLSKLGNAHEQALSGIIVNFDLTCSNKMWVELERYKFIVFVSSQSTMHRISKFDLKNSYIEYVDYRIIKIMEELKETYNATKDKDDYLKLLYSNPSGFKLTARLTTNYRCLKNIYNQRIVIPHRLPEWLEFGKWIQRLPYFKELCIL